MSRILRDLDRNNKDWAKSSGPNADVKQDFPKASGQPPTVTTGTWPKTEKPEGR